MPGATIQIEGTPRGVITDVDGSFAIDALPSNRLIISFIGMETQTLAIGNRNEFLVKMQPKVDELEEVAVVAFGKQKKESVIGAITTVTPKDLKIPSSNLTTALPRNVPESREPIMQIFLFVGWARFIRKRNAIR